MAQGNIYHNDDFHQNTQTQSSEGIYLKLQRTSTQSATCKESNISCGSDRNTASAPPPPPPIRTDAPTEPTERNKSVCKWLLTIVIVSLAFVLLIYTASMTSAAWVVSSSVADTIGQGRNPCLSSPCQFNGSCSRLSDGYICFCAPGYYGAHCQYEENYCRLNPCEFGGTCTNQVDGYTCKCTPDYYGVRCQYELNHCLSSPCEFGATCTNQVGGYTCSCSPGYYGVRCQYETCVFYVTEQANMSTANSIVGYISKVDEFGNVVRLANGGEDGEIGIVTDGSLLFYTTYSPAKLWRLSIDNPSGTNIVISQYCNTGNCYAFGLGISRSDQRLFVDYYASSLPNNYVRMMDYDGDFLNVTSLSTPTTLMYRVYGLAVDEVNRTLFLTHFDNETIYAIPYTLTTLGTVRRILSGSPLTGLQPTGLVFHEQEKKLYWILYSSGEIRSMLVGSNSSEVVVPSNTTGVNTYGLSICRDNFYYTSNSLGGIWITSSVNETRIKITTANTLHTIGISIN